MTRYREVMGRKNLLEAGGFSKKAMVIYLSTRRHIPLNSSHLVNRRVWDFQISIHLWRANMMKQRRALKVLRDGLEGCFHVAVCGTGLCYPRDFICEKRFNLIKSVVHPSFCPHGNRYALNGFLWNLIFEDLSKICREHSILIKVFTWWPVHTDVII
jgi:hypothetical protein